MIFFENTKQPSHESALFYNSQIEPNLNKLTPVNYKLLKDIYTYADRIMQEQDNFSCQKGCSSCCKIDVHVTELEARYIVKNTKFTMKTNKSPSFNHKTSCPFLVDDCCSIYEYRPFMCRKHATINPSYFCLSPTVPVNLFSNSNLNNLTQIMFTKLKWRDIRDWF